MFCLGLLKSSDARVGLISGAFLALLTAAGAGRVVVIDRESPPGNHIVLRCHGVAILMAHLKNRSVIPREGDRVSHGQPIGRVGNSGNTSEPHLHLHSVRTRGSPTHRRTHPNGVRWSLSFHE